MENNKYVSQWQQPSLTEVIAAALGLGGLRLKLELKVSGLWGGEGRGMLCGLPCLPPQAAHYGCPPCMIHHTLPNARAGHRHG